MPALKQRNALAHYEAENAGALAAPFQGLGEPGYYYPTTASFQGLVYSTTHVKPEDVPRACTDLLDPKWQGRVGLAHPAFSGYFGQWVLAMRKLHGWEFFEKLAKNNPRIGRSGNDPLTLVNAGECLVGTGPLSTTMQNVDKGNPVGFIYPEDATVITVGPVRGAGRRAAPERRAAVPGMAVQRRLRAGLRRMAPGAGARRRAADEGHQTDRRVQVDRAEHDGDRQGHPRGDRAMARYVWELR